MEADAMQLSDLFRSAEKNTKPIPYQDFVKVGWSQAQYLYYLDLCIHVQAAAICAENLQNLENEGVVEIHTSSRSESMIINIAFKNLVDWLEQGLEQKVEPCFNIDYRISEEKRFLPHQYYSEDSLGTSPYLFKDFDSFRLSIEQLISKALKGKKIEFTEKQKLECSKSVAEANLRALQRRISELEQDICRDLYDISNYPVLADWAQKKAASIQELSKLHNEINEYEEYIEGIGERVGFDVTKNVLYVYKAFIKCERNHHHIISVNAVLKSLSGADILINANYCTECKSYFISYDEYLHYKQMYGVLLGNIVIITNGEYVQASYVPASESPLHLCGYTVSQAEGLTATERQSLLSKLIDYGIMKKPDIIKYLNLFISMNGQRFGNEIATRKWTEDLDFVRRYGMEKQDIAEISKIERYPGYEKLR